MIGDKIQGLDEEVIEDYIHYLGNLRWTSLGSTSLYEDDLKEPKSMRWVSRYSNTNMIKTDFFEAKNIVYTENTALEDNLQSVYK